jgi:hypothetical protein
VAIIILATLAAYIAPKTLAYNKSRLPSLSNFALAKTPFKA